MFEDYSNIPANMRAWQYEKHGDPQEVLSLKSDVPVPKITKDNEVLVIVRAAAINPVGWKSMKSFPSVMVKKPCIPEMDLSGVVAVTGTKVTSVKPGDEVYGIIPAEIEMKTGIGALAQYTIVQEEHLIKKSDKISFAEAAAIPLASMTAYEALVDIGGLKSGQRVFVNGGSGGVGTFAVQIAKSLGAYVVASCSDKNVDFVKGLGADEVIDYKAGDLPTQLKEKHSANKFDIICDIVGSSEVFRQSESYMNESGIHVQIGAPADGVWETMKVGAQAATNTLLPAFLGGTNRRFKFMMLKSTKDKLVAVNDLVISGKVKPIIDSEYSFEDTKEAYKKSTSNRAKGKVVINVN